MKTQSIDSLTAQLAKTYFVNDLHQKDESFMPGKRVILQSKETYYEGTITGFFNITRASLGLKVDLLGDIEILFFRNPHGYYTSGKGDENHLLFIHQTEFGTSLPELSKSWLHDSHPEDLLFMTLGMSINDLESLINRTVKNEELKISLNKIVSHPNFYNPFAHKDAVFVKFINPEDEKHFQAEFYTPGGVELIRVS